MIYKKNLDTCQAKEQCFTTSKSGQGDGVLADAKKVIAASFHSSQQLRRFFAPLRGTACQHSVPATKRCRMFAPFPRQSFAGCGSPFGIASQARPPVLPLCYCLKCEKIHLNTAMLTEITQTKTEIINSREQKCLTERKQAKNKTN